MVGRFHPAVWLVNSINMLSSRAVGLVGELTKLHNITVGLSYFWLLNSVTS